MPSLRSRFIYSLVQFAMPGGKRKLSFVERRLRTDAAAERFIRAPRGITVEKVTIGGMHAEWHIPKNHPASRVVLYLHGGGYTFCSPATHRGLAGRIALASQARVLVIDYRLAPEHPFPAALEDALTTWHLLLYQGISVQNLVIAGDSAGGGLALATALRLRQKKEALPAAVVLISPWVDLAASGEFAKPYVGEGDSANPLISPVFGDLSHLPPILIQAGGADFLLEDSRKLERKLVQAEGEVSLEVWKDKVHVFQATAPLDPAASHAIRHIGEFIRKQIP